MNSVPGKPELSDSRRLTGANLFWDFPSAIIDAELDSNPDALIAAWSAAARNLLAALDMPQQQLCHRSYKGGCSLLISAPVDVLYSMCELNEAAFALALADLGFEAAPDFDDTVNSLEKLFADEANPALLALQNSAREHDVPFLWDDDHVSVGYGKTALVWEPVQLPQPDNIDWPAIGSIPVALVTGTNGKSTTVRMAAAIIAASGKRAGLTSTDWIRIGETILDTGDYSGTGGARTLMRHPETEVAVLETARGGLLRRGLGVEKVAAALITNVAADHLGEYGIDTVDDLIEAKFIVRRALGDDAPLILNADDAGVVQFAGNLDCKINWFSLDADNPIIRNHQAAGGSVTVMKDGMLQLINGQSSRQIITAENIPATAGGAARHNIQNALAAIALCDVLGAGEKAMKDGLAGFRGDEADNPGRGNWFEGRGVKILVDFAHNAHGTQALAHMVSAMPAERRILLTGQAGDRSDEDIYEMIGAACEMKADVVLACALPGYERGRPASEVQNVIRSASIDNGVEKQNVIDFDTPLEAAEYALEAAREGDLLVFLALTQRDEVIQKVHDFINGSGS